MRPLWFSLALLVFGVAGIRAARARRRNKRVLQRLAYDHRLNFSPEDLIGLPERYHNLTLLRCGHARCVSDVVHGAIDVGLLSLFRQSCDLGFGVHQTSLRWWVAVIETPVDLGCWRFGPLEAVATVNETRFPYRRAQGDRLLQTRRSDTLDAVSRTVLPEIADHPGIEWEIEAHHHLLAVRLPFAPGREIPDRLLAFTRRLAARLTKAAVPTFSTSPGLDSTEQHSSPWTPTWRSGA